MPLPVEVWLVHPDEHMCSAWRNHFSGLSEVRILNIRFKQLPPHDCFVTAGNCYGIMTAGIDAAVVGFLGEELMKSIQFRIMDEYLGEQPVGTSFVQSTGTPDYPFVAHTPTMRVPGSIDGTDHVYVATWAAFLAVYRHNTQHFDSNRINTIVFPALGAGFGGVSYWEVARQMSAAFRHYLNPPHRMDWNMVVNREKQIAWDGDRQVVR